MIKRNVLKILKQRFKNYPILAILGPRQCGKTTLAFQFYNTCKYIKKIFFDCKNPRDLIKLETPMLFLENFNGLIVIDEIQYRPEIFPILRVLVDKYPKTKFLILGSASRDLISQSSETLAGRISYIELSGFNTNEIKNNEVNKLWLRGGFPKSFLSKNNISSVQWREDFIKTFLERDIPNLGIHIPPHKLRKFWTMLSHFHGQIFNALNIGKSLNISDKTIKNYLDILTGTFVIRQIQPWFYNTKKRLVKKTKIYFRDSGLLHSFFNIENLNDLYNHPQLGNSWEGFAMEQIIINLNLNEDNIFFWSLHSGAELDLLFQKNARLFGIEFKFTDTPKITKSMFSALKELDLKHLWVVYPGKDLFPLDKKITAVGIEKIANILK